MEYTIRYDFGLCRLYSANNKDDIINEENLNELSESDFEGVRGYSVTNDKGERIIKNMVPFTDMDLAFDDELLEKLEGKYLMLHFVQNAIGEEKHEVDDINSLKPDEEIDHGLVNSLTDDDGNYYELEEIITEFDTPDDFHKDYFIVENGKIAELEEVDGKFNRIDEE